MTERLHFSLFTFMNWRRKWQPTSVFLPGEFHGQRSLVGYSLWSQRKSDTTKATYFKVTTPVTAHIFFFFFGQVESSENV